MKTTWLVVGGAAALWACDAVKVDPNLPYIQEADGGCAVAGQQPWSDGFCHPGPQGQTGGGTGGGTGGATGGGTGGGTGGAVDAGEVDAGQVDAGTADAGPADAGPACVPTTCAANGWNCGAVDAGCGVQLNCGACDPARFEACGVSGVPNVCAPAEICSDDGWCWQNPLPQGNTLRAVWVNGPNDVWTGGDHGTLLHWDGEKWSRLAIPKPYSTIRGIVSFGSDVWIVVDTRILKWNGTSWQPEKTGASDWTAIAGTAASNLFAVSATQLSVRATGGSWSDFSLPASLYAGTSLWVDGSGSAFVGGLGGLFRFSSGVFAQTAEIAGQTDAIAGLPNGAAFAINHATIMDVFIVRRTDAGWSTEQSFLYQTDAGPQAGMSFPWAVRSLTADGVTGFWAFGDDGAQAKLDGGQWVEVRPPERGPDGGVGSSLFAAHAGGGDLWSVGQSGTTWRLDGGSLSQVSAGPLGDLAAVSAGTSSGVWATGSLGTVRIGRPTWSAQAQCPGNASSIWADQNGDAYLVTETQGCVLGASGGATPFNPGTFPQQGYTAIVGPSPFYVVGRDPTSSSITRGTVQGSSWDGGGIFYESSLISGAWRAADRSETWFVSSNKIYKVLGDSAQVIFDSDVNADVGAVFGVGKAGGGNDVFVVGDAGYIGRRVGGASFPDSVSTSNTQGLNAGAGDGVGHGWIIGSAGTLLELQSLTATARESGTSNDLRAVASLPDAGVWVVGAGGTILHHR